MRDLPAPQLVVLTSVLVAGLVGTVVAVASRGADSNFLHNQQHPASLKPADVERVVRTAPDPQVGKGSGIAATCTPQASGPLRNPWSCVVRYKSGRRARLRVRVANDGSYLGRYAGGGAAEGCCIEIPGAE